MVRAHLPFLDIRSFNKEMYLIFSLIMYCHFSTFIVRPLCDTLSFRSQLCACIFNIMATTKARVKNYSETVLSKIRFIIRIPHALLLAEIDS